MYSPVKPELFSFFPGNDGASYSTIMNWQSHPPIKYKNKSYGQKDIELMKFLRLPLLVTSPIEMAVSGKEVPFKLLHVNKWLTTDAHEITTSFDSFCNYIKNCRGEFSVCKNIFVENNTAWFSDKSAAFLASGRPVVLQNTGFDKYLPSGKGLFAVHDANEAAEAINIIESNYKYHCKKAREIAVEYFDSKKVMGLLLDKLGV